MLSWIVIFFLLAIIAGLFGFSGLAGTFVAIAQFLAGLFAIMFIAAMIHSLINAPETHPPI